MNFELPNQINFQEVLKVRKYIYFPLLTIIVVVSLLAFVVIPSIRQIALLRSEIEKRKEALARLEEKVEILNNLDENTLLSQVEVLERALPSRKDVFSLLISLDGLAVQNQVALGKLSLNPGRLATASASESASQGRLPADAETGRSRAIASSNLSSIEVGIEVSGALEAMRAFLLGLEKLVPLMRLTSLELGPATQETAPIISTASAFPIAAEVSGSLTIAMFYAPLPTQLGAVSDPVETLSESDAELYATILSYTSFSATASASVQTGREDVFAPF